ncbi:MAG: hypothetical protein V9G19_03140 [Tetrasphaera sp.]
MPTLAPAAVLGGRYTAQRLLGERAGAQSWAGIDAASGAPVVLHVLPAANPQAPAVLDAARRTTGIHNPRVVRILDAGTDGAHVFFVEEALEGGQTLAQLAGRGGLAASEVRRLTGEAATGLDAAQRRGLHHLFLTPESVIRLPDGSVKLAGLATEAALAGQDHIGGPRALRRDAQGLVSLAYAGLTGRWPHGGDTGLAAAPRVFGGVPRPSEIAVGVPTDLDTICRQTFSEGLGPSSPGDYAAQIAPWPPLTGTSLGLRDVADSADPDSAAAVAGPAGDESDPEELIATHPRSVPPDRSPTPAVAASPEPLTAPLPASTPTTSTTEPGADSDTDGPPAEPASVSSAPAEGPSAASGRVGVVAGRAGAATAALTSRLGGLTKTASTRAGAALSERRSFKAAMREEEDRSRVGLSETQAAGGYESPAPLLPAEAGAPPSPAQRRLVLVVFAAVVAIAGFLAAIGVSKIGSHTDIESILGGSSARPQPSVSVAPTSSAPGSGEALGIVSATGYDPDGNDKSENNDLAPRVYDEDPTSSWQTEGYENPRFSGLKDGVGVLLDMGQVVTPREARLIVPTASPFDLYISNDPGLDGATKIGSGVGNGTNWVTVETGGRTPGRFVIVWFTDAPQQPDGRYRSALAEIVLTG